jgi:hypothetical protein
LEIATLWLKLRNYFESTFNLSGKLKMKNLIKRQAIDWRYQQQRESNGNQPRQLMSWSSEVDRASRKS